MSCGTDHGGRVEVRLASVFALLHSIMQNNAAPIRCTMALNPILHLRCRPQLLSPLAVRIPGIHDDEEYGAPLTILEDFHPEPPLLPCRHGLLYRVPSAKQTH
jgi:hypothetical protein